MNQLNLRDQLASYFSESELNDLCFDLNIDYENLPDQTKLEKARELIIYCQRHGRMADLMARCQELRPQLSWEYQGGSPPKVKEPERENKARSTLAGRVMIGSFVIVICAIAVVYLLQNNRVASSSSVASGDEDSVTGTDVPTADQTNAIETTSAAPLPTMPPLPVELPDGSEVKLVSSTSTYQYTILSAERESLPPDRYLLHLRVRVWTNSLGGMNFWRDSFRLVVDDRYLTPVNSLNKVVGQDETMDGDVDFEVDQSLTEAVLVIKASTNFPDNSKELRLVFP